MMFSKVMCIEGEEMLPKANYMVNIPVLSCDIIFFPDPGLTIEVSNIPIKQ